MKFMSEQELIEKFRAIADDFKSVNAKVDRIYDFNSSINTKLELLKKDMENMQKQADDTTTAIKSLSKKLDTLNDKPKNNLFKFITEGKKTAWVIGWTILLTTIFTNIGPILKWLLSLLN